MADRWCGVVITDRGTFRLPESGFSLGWHQRREVIADTLKAGCRQRFIVTGSQPINAPGDDRPSNRVNRISKVLETEKCNL